MIFRALFWIGVVALLTPHEPDLGLGRPGAGTPLPSPATSAAASGLSRTGVSCGFPACAGALSILGNLPTLRLPVLSAKPEGRSLSDVKDEIEAAMRARDTRI